jgi:hypothetical protein
MVAEIDEYLKDNILHHYKVNSEVFNGLNTFINNRDKRLTSLFLRNLFNGKNGTIICNGINVVADFNDSENFMENIISTHASEEETPVK